jgi:hypothetical protein
MATINGWRGLDAHRYANAPTLEPLEWICAQAAAASMGEAGAAQTAALSGRRGSLMAAGQQQGLGERGSRLRLQLGGPPPHRPDQLGYGYPVWLDEQKVAHADGKRKTSTAKVGHVCACMRYVVDVTSTGQSTATLRVLRSF